MSLLDLLIWNPFVLLRVSCGSISQGLTFPSVLSFRFVCWSPAIQVVYLLPLYITSTSKLHSSSNSQIPLTLKEYCKLGAMCFIVDPWSASWAPHNKLSIAMGGKSILSHCSHSQGFPIFNYCHHWQLFREYWILFFHNIIDNHKGFHHLCEYLGLMFIHDKFSWSLSSWNINQIVILIIHSLHSPYHYRYSFFDIVVSDILSAGIKPQLQDNTSESFQLYNISS